MKIKNEDHLTVKVLWIGKGESKKNSLPENG